MSNISEVSFNLAETVAKVSKLYNILYSTIDQQSNEAQFMLARLKAAEDSLRQAFLPIRTVPNNVTFEDKLIIANFAIIHWPFTVNQGQKIKYQRDAGGSWKDETIQSFQLASQMGISIDFFYEQLVSPSQYPVQNKKHNQNGFWSLFELPFSVSVPIAILMIVLMIMLFNFHRY